MFRVCSSFRGKDATCPCYDRIMANAAGSFVASDGGEEPGIPGPWAGGDMFLIARDTSGQKHTLRRRRPDRRRLSVAF